ncbi:hypothetical protein IFM89_002402 [Coptis chinensis]|uniref:HTH myb-type domain-containing protein n=1 Tax=Coptis chinensis TaxID=261450 RepID=A0A835ILZ7_9MAGN|nr:hypothetical protein IFM89_002402 [Coptis chinensis]
MDDNWDPFHIDSPATFPHSVPSETPIIFPGWTVEENNQFHIAISELDILSVDLYENIASRIPGKTIEQIQDRFHAMLTFDGFIDDDSGGCPMPKYDNNDRVLNNEEPAETSKKSVPRKRTALATTRRPGDPWNEKEHKLFLLGLKECRKGNWKGIARFYVRSKNALQVASHAQKYYKRRDNPGNFSGRRKSILDIHDADDTIKPKSRNSRWVPIAPSPFPPQPPIIPHFVDYNSLIGSRIRNKYRLSTLCPIEKFTYEINSPSVPSTSNDTNNAEFMNYQQNDEFNADSPSNYLLSEPIPDFDPSSF